MKTIYLILIVVLCFLSGTNQTIAQSLDNYPETYSSEEWESQWGFNGPEHTFSMNYTLFGKSYSRGLWVGGLGYATGMWLSGNNTTWGVVGSFLAVNIPIMFDSDYDIEEIWVGQNLGALTVSVSATFIIEVNQRGRMRFTIPKLIRRR